MKVVATTVSLAVETKDKAAADAVKDAAQQNTSERPSVIIVEVLGYGGGDGNPAPASTDDDPRGRQGDRRGDRQDPRSPARFVGYGNLTEQQKQQLSDAERENL